MQNVKKQNVKKISILWVLITLYINSIYALDTNEFNDAKLQQRYGELTAELRCLVCQNETIAGSNAPLAQDLRNKVAEQLRAGLSDEEIREYLINRYGDFVSYRPSKTGVGQILWLAPSVLILLCILIFMYLLKQNRVTNDE